MFTPVEFGKVSVLIPENGGAVPYGNTVVVRGSEGTLVMDPSLSLDRDPVGADLVFVSHGHEDHIAGLRHFDTPVYAHHLDAPAVASLDTLLTNYSLPPGQRAEVQQSIATQYGIPSTHENVAGIDDGHVFDLGDRTATVIHLPGHTRGHCGVLVEPDGFFYVADIDLTSFGPMYGDLGSSVNDFLDSIDHVATIDARWYGTFHQKGVIEGSDEFRRRLTAYRDKLLSREERLVNFLDEPQRLEDIVAHRLVYRPHVSAPYVDAVERRTAQLHLERLIASGAVITVADKTYRRVL